MPGSGPPTLLQSWVDDIQTTWRHHRIHVLPWKLVSCGAAGWLFAFQIQSAFFFPRNWDVSIAVYSGFLAFNALTMALAWSGINRVYDTLSSPKFSNFLQFTGVLAKYQFVLGFIHTVQSIAALVTIAGMGSLLVSEVPLFWDRFALAATVGSTLYALWWAYSAAKVARELSWHYATFDGLDDEQIQIIRLAVDNTSQNTRSIKA